MTSAYDPSALRADHPTLGLIRHRALSSSGPYDRSDKDKLGLVIEGGGMRSVVTAGMTTALEHLALWDVFDGVYGVSGGALTGAYFSARQATFGTTMFYEALNDNRFLHPMRIGPGRHLMSLEYIVHDVAEKQMSLDYDAVLDARLPLHVFCSSASRGIVVDLGSGKTKRDVQLRLLAAARIPFVAGAPVEIDGDRYYDAGLIDSIPYRQAIADGCTHLLVLLSRPLGNPRPAQSFPERFFLARELQKQAPALRAPYLDRVERYNAEVAELSRTSVIPGTDVPVVTVSPDEQEPAVGQFTRDRAKLVRGAKSGMDAIYQALLGRTMPVHELLWPMSNGYPVPRPHV